MPIRRKDLSTPATRRVLAAAATTIFLAGCAGDVKGVLTPVASTVPGASKVTMLVATTRAADPDAGVLFSGDQPQVCPDRRWVSFMYSYPNLIPLAPRVVDSIVATLDAYEFDRIYGAFHPRTVATDARRVIAASKERYMRAISR